MKKVLLSVLVAVFALVSTNAMAQEETKPAKLRWQGHQTNSFWSNWEVSAGFGSSYLDINTKGSDPGKFFKRNGWNANFAVTKWFVPIVGARLQLDGGQFLNYSDNQAVYGDNVFKSPYVFVHADAMLNLSNWIGGYREDRVYYAIPYAGFGYTAMNWTDDTVGSYNGEFAFTAGLLNKFRVCKFLDIQLDLRTWLFPQRDLAPQINDSGAYAVTFSASVGVAYRFNKRNWDVAHTQAEVDGYLAAIADRDNRLDDANNKLTDANNKINDLNNENDRLKNDLDECNKARKAIKPAKTPETVVFFNFNQSVLTGYSKATLKSYAAQVKDGDEKLTVIGYADKQTGSAEVNERISQKRAEAVKAYLVEQGIAEDRIEVKWVGSSEEAFADEAARINRCVIIR